MILNIDMISLAAVGFFVFFNPYNYGGGWAEPNRRSLEYIKAKRMSRRKNKINTRRNQWWWYPRGRRNIG